MKAVICLRKGVIIGNYVKVLVAPQQVHQIRYHPHFHGLSVIPTQILEYLDLQPLTGNAVSHIEV